MTPARRQTYHRGRDRREVITAVLAVVAILAVTGALLVLFKPDDDAPTAPSTPPITLPTDSAPPASTPLQTLPTDSLPTDSTTVPSTPTP